MATETSPEHGDETAEPVPGSARATAVPDAATDDPRDRLIRHPGDLVRVACGSTATVAAAWLARDDRVGTTEEALFRLVNRLPDAVAPALTIVMQAGSLAAVGVAAGTAAVLRRSRLAVDLLIGGGATWVTIKAVKAWVSRARPSGVLSDVVVRGAEQTGLGYPSGHAAVAAALATVAGPWLPRPWRRATWGSSSWSRSPACTSVRTCHGMSSVGRRSVGPWAPLSTSPAARPAAFRRRRW